MISEAPLFGYNFLMSDQANYNLTALFIAIPIILTVAIAIAAIKCAELQLSRIFTSFERHHCRKNGQASSKDATSGDSLDVERGKQQCPVDSGKSQTIPL